jgi:two-component sensor histidine kinase
MNGAAAPHHLRTLGLAAPRWVQEIACAILAAGLAGALRLVVDLFAPQAAPFVFVFPAALLATLLAGWRSGLLALVILVLGAWYLTLSPNRAFAPLTDMQAAAVVLHALAGLLVIALAEGFRKAASAADQVGAAKLEVRDLLLRELNHRVKNNFQMVTALLEMQRRRAADAASEVALADALRRVQSMAQAHAYLYSPDDTGEALDLAAYLSDLCASLSDSLLLTGLVRLECQLQPVRMSRDRAVAMGLVVNELVTNSAKYAFPAGRAGTITVTLRRIEVGAELTVADDGVGLPPESAIRAGGLGRRLVESFARQAGAILTRGEGPGARYVLVLPDAP